MDTGYRSASITARAGATALVFAALAIIALIAAPLFLEAPFLGILVTGSDSVGTIAGSFALVLLLAGSAARGILRAAMSRWPEREHSFRLGVVLVPALALGGLIVGLTTDWAAGTIAFVALPAAFAVAMGAATAWIARPR